jgi:hypothetical protein
MSKFDTFYAILGVIILGMLGYAYLLPKNEWPNFDDGEVLHCAEEAKTSITLRDGELLVGNFDDDEFLSYFERYSRNELWNKPELRILSLTLSEDRRFMSWGTTDSSRRNNRGDLQFFKCSPSVGVFSQELENAITCTDDSVLFAINFSTDYFLFQNYYPVALGYLDISPVIESNSSLKTRLEAEGYGFFSKGTCFSYFSEAANFLYPED